MLKSLIYKLPKGAIVEIKRLYCIAQIKGGKFKSEEAEYKILEHLVNNGDWVIDVGANIGHYTYKLSLLVGNEGRVIAFEPIPLTFQLLVSNCNQTGFDNVTALNLAATQKSELRAVSIPSYANGTINYYQAHLDNWSSDSIKVFCIAIDSLNIPKTVSLVKIDAEGHDYDVLIGMDSLIKRDKPAIIIEDSSETIFSYLSDLNYQKYVLNGSHNAIFCTEGSRASAYLSKLTIN